MSFLNSLKNATNVAFTENGGRAYATTGSDLLNFFAQGGALRSRNESDVISIFTKAYAEDKLLALKTAFYFRDVRGGQGERKTFRTILKYMANAHAETLSKNLHLVPFYGRWDDLYAVFGTKLEAQAAELIKTRFNEDMQAEHPSLLGKWLASENASSFQTRELARKTMKHLGLTPRQYRKALSGLRKKIRIVETLMSSKQWSEIDYSKLPSQASLKYRQAFFRNDLERYQSFLASLAKGETKVNAKTLYPYEIARQVGSYHSAQDDVLNALWEALPDYFDSKTENSLAVVDVSGSMIGTPMDVAVSLGLYTAERNKGLFHNHFITFSRNPQLVEVKGSTFCEKIRNIKQADWNMNTNISRVFRLILNTAKENQLPQEEMPKRLYIISDMEFDAATRNSNTSKTVFETLRQEYVDAGYEMPQLVFWNVDARNEQFPMKMDDRGVMFVSGCSPSIFTNLLKGEFMSPFDLMLDVIGSERYSSITV